jgi:hypothetical protein
MVFKIVPDKGIFRNSPDRYPKPLSLQKAKDRSRVETCLEMFRNNATSIIGRNCVNGTRQTLGTQPVVHMKLAYCKQSSDPIRPRRLYKSSEEAGRFDPQRSTPRYPPSLLLLFLCHWLFVVKYRLTHSLTGKFQFTTPDWTRLDVTSNKGRTRTPLQTRHYWRGRRGRYPCARAISTRRTCCALSWRTMVPA